MGGLLWVITANRNTTILLQNWQFFSASCPNHLTMTSQRTAVVLLLLNKLLFSPCFLFEKGLLLDKVAVAPLLGVVSFTGYQSFSTMVMSLVVVIPFLRHLSCSSVAFFSEAEQFHSWLQVCSFNTTFPAALRFKWVHPSLTLAQKHSENVLFKVCLPWCFRNKGANFL